jgi:hypothetical protein
MQMNAVGVWSATYGSADLDQGRYVGARCRPTLPPSSDGASACPCSVREQVPTPAESNQERTSNRREILGSYRCVLVAVAAPGRLRISGSQIRSLRARSSSFDRRVQFGGFAC